MGPAVRVLIIEDSEDDARLMVRLLEHGGLAVSAKRIERTAALACALAEEVWDVLLVDWNLSGFDGWEALRLVKESGRDLPFIIVSEVMGEETAVAALKAGAHDVVHKTQLGRLVPVVARELADAEVRRARVRVEAALRQSLIELGEANDRLREADRHKEEFLSMISHALRTPIHVLMDFLKRLETRMEGSPDDQPHGYMNRAKAAAEVLARLVNDMLDLSQLHAGTFSLYPDWVEVGPLVGVAVGTMAELAKQKAIRLTMALAPGLPAVWADRDRLEQVLSNLLVNAIKFTPEGGAVTVEGYADAESLRITVADTGIGIAKADQARLFHPFTQLDMSLNRAVGGVGIGLSICLAIVHAHGGEMGVDSEPGRGSRFWFSLPLRAPEGAESTQEEAPR